MNSSFRKPGCDCTGCVSYGEHQDPNEFRGWHYMTLTHGAGTDTVSCRCGWKHTDWTGLAGAGIAQHRLDEGLIHAQG